MGKVNLAKFEKYDHKSGVNCEVVDMGSFNYNRISINWSDIQDRLIRLAAKYTDFYASDVLISINHIQQQIDSGEFSPVYMFGFRESGVDHMEYVLNVNEDAINHEYRAIWRLTVDNERANGLNSVTMSLHKVWYNPYGKVADCHE